MEVCPMKTIYKTIIDACNNSRLNMLDINPEFFFGEVVPYPIPFDDCDILDYISSLTDGFLESENKMVIYNGHISKIDIDVQDCMIDNEELECYPVAILESYEEVIRIYCLKGNPDMVYLVSKDYDSNDDKTTYCLNVLVKLD
jgi:hypothetical protein